MRSIATILLALGFIATHNASAQDVDEEKNLIKNGGFEEFEGKLKKPGQLEFAKNWKSPTPEKADLFNANITYEDVNVPTNEFGSQQALNGDGYAGIRVYSYKNEDPRTYLTAALKKPLIKGQDYCVRYYVSLSDLSKYGSNEISTHFSKWLVRKNEEGNLDKPAQVPQLRTTVYKDPYAWKGICEVYKAAGDEAYMVIGNFVENDATITEKVNPPEEETRPQLFESYYYIDDVAVYPVKSKTECKCDDVGDDYSDYIFGKKSTTNKTLSPTDQVDKSTIYFKRFDARIDPSMKLLLGELIELLKADEALKLKLTGHMEEVEDQRIKIRPDLHDIDTRRAASVKKYFQDNGIAADRIETTGLGKTKPADGGDDQVAMAKNRRVEIDVVK